MFWDQCSRNIFSNDLFQSIPVGKLHSYADDSQIYDSHKEPKELDKLIQRHVTSGNQWFDINGMICNPTKHQVNGSWQQIAL